MINIENNSISKKKNTKIKQEEDKIKAFGFLIGITKGHLRSFKKYID